MTKIRRYFLQNKGYQAKTVRYGPKNHVIAKSTRYDPRREMVIQRGDYSPPKRWLLPKTRHCFPEQRYRLKIPMGV